MIQYKTEEEIQIMKESGRKLRAAVQKLIPLVVPGISTMEIDKLAEKFIRDEHAEPSFKRVEGYEWTICAPINEQVVHTPPGTRIVNEGDMLTIDIGAYFKGYHSDFATTFIVGRNPNDTEKRFLDTGKSALEFAIKKAVYGNRLGEISKTIEEIIYNNGYHILEQLTGHGIGTELHEDPFVPGFLNKKLESTLRIKEGLVLAIEVIYSMGTEDIAHEKGDNWSIVTADGSLSACFEHTVAITAENTFILT